MRESDLYIPVRDYLKTLGYKIHVEKFDADIVATVPDATAVSGVRVIVVELKLGMTAKLFEQLSKRSGWADEVWAAVPFDPKKVKRGGCRHAGYGLICVWNGRAKKVLGPKRQPHWFHSRRAYRVKRLACQNEAQDHEIAGLPSCRELRMQRQLAVSLLHNATVKE